MTDEMLDLARANAQTGRRRRTSSSSRATSRSSRSPDATVDVVISNCVINLAADKTIVLREAARVLRPGGRLAISDVIADPDLDEATRADVAAWTGCIAGALTEVEFRSTLRDAGFEAIEITPTHRVHRQRGSGHHPRTQGARRVDLSAAGPRRAPRVSLEARAVTVRAHATNRASTSPAHGLISRFFKYHSPEAFATMSVAHPHQNTLGEAPSFTSVVST